MMDLPEEAQGDDAELLSPEAQYEKELQELINTTLAEEREHFHSDVESFSAHEERLRLEIKTEFEEFQRRFAHGYEVLLNEVLQYGGPIETPAEEEPPPSQPRSGSSYLKP